MVHLFGLPSLLFSSLLPYSFFLAALLVLACGQAVHCILQYLEVRRCSREGTQVLGGQHVGWPTTASSCCSRISHGLTADNIGTQMGC